MRVGENPYLVIGVLREELAQARAATEALTSQLLLAERRAEVNRAGLERLMKKLEGIADWGNEHTADRIREAIAEFSQPKQDPESEGS